MTKTNRTRDPLCVVMLACLLVACDQGAQSTDTNPTAEGIGTETEQSQAMQSGMGQSLASQNPDAVARNNRGVALMGYFDYDAAQGVFADLVQDYPDWVDARLNLAIATLNRQQSGDEQAARAMAEAVLSEDAQQLRAHYIAGILTFNAGDMPGAESHFAAVVQGDPDDAYGQYFLSQARAQLGEFEQALAGYQQALRLDPYLRSAYYGAFTAAQRLGQRDQAREFLADYQRLANNPRARLAEIKYTRMGPKAMALAVGQVTPMDSATTPEGPLFGAPLALGRLPPATTHLALGDLSGDQRLDLVINGQQLAVGLEQGFGLDDLQMLGQNPAEAAMAAVGDLDNDGYNDLFQFSAQGGMLLQRQADAWQSINLSAPARDALLVDADHDGDLDVLLAGADGRVELINNNRDGSFRALAEEAGLTGPAQQVLVTDFDGDRDLDLVFRSEQGLRIYRNDRLWQWQPVTLPDAVSSLQLTTLVAGDLDADGQVEFYGSDGQGAVLRITYDRAAPAEQAWNWSGLTGGPGQISQWMALADANGDGVEDLWLAATQWGWQVYAVTHDQLDSLFADATGAQAWTLMPGADGPEMLAQVDGQLMHWPAGSGRHQFLTLQLSGAEDEGQSMRSNRSGIGAHLALRRGANWSITRSVRRDSGPGASLLPVQFGLGSAEVADYIAIEWSDGVFQTELDLRPGDPAVITETQRQLASCPVLFAWNGVEFAFVSDVLGVGGIGFGVGRGEYATPRPWENFLFPPGTLVARDGFFEIRFTEPMEELAYLDAVDLLAYDLPPGWDMLLDERMGTGHPQPTGEAWFFDQRIDIQRAWNGQGLDSTHAVQQRDQRAADLGPPDARFLGFLDQVHSMSVEFGEQALPVALASQERTPVLVMDGWVEYGYSQTGFAAWQAGVRYQPPSLDVRVAGQWQSHYPQFGYPAGMPRRAALPLFDLPASTDALRLSTNQEIYYDQLFLAMATRDLEVPVHHLPLASARVAKSGFPTRQKLAQRRPDYDYSERLPFWDTRYAAGYYTRLGPALGLVSERDDALAIIGPGEEIQLRFADQLPPLAAGWTRRYVARFYGWAKDMDLYTRDGETVGPLPTTGADAQRRDQLHAEYNTRYQAGR